jgi:hypothetical protein
MVFFSLVKSNMLTMAFKSRVFFYKELEVMEELAFFSNRVGFSYLYIVVKKYNLVSALVVAYNGKGASNISINEFE